MCNKPSCDFKSKTIPDNRCVCYKPIMISIKPGEHVHIKCPVHGDRILANNEIHRL